MGLLNHLVLGLAMTHVIDMPAGEMQVASDVTGIQVQRTGQRGYTRQDAGRTRDHGASSAGLAGP